MAKALERGILASLLCLICSLAVAQGKLIEGTKFKDAFNAAKDDLRVLVILSPSCMACLNGAKEVGAQVVTKISDSRLKVFIVWTPAYGTDDNKLALEGVELVKDKRVQHYWDANSEIALDFGKVVTVPRDSPLAYDVYFIYTRGAKYEKDAPKPFDYMHQILDGPRFFEAEKFVAILKKQLSLLK